MASLWELFVKISSDNTDYKKSMKENAEVTEAFGAIAESAGVKIASSLSLLGVATLAIESAEKFEQAGFKIQRSTGATGEKLEGLEKSLHSLYTNSGRSADELGAVLSQLSIRTGLSGDALEKLAGSALRYSKVSGADLGTSVERNQKLFAQWGVTTSQQSAALDVLYATQTNTGIGAERLGESLMSMSPILRSFGFNFTEAAAIMGTFERAGLDATDVSKGLNTAFIKFAAAGKDPKQALVELIEKMNDASTATEAVNLAVEGGFAKKAAVAMANAAQRGALNLQDLLDVLQESRGEVDRVSAATVSLKENWVKLTHVFEEMASGPGATLLKFFTDVGSFIADAAKDAKSLYEALVNIEKVKGNSIFKPGASNNRPLYVPGMSLQQSQQLGLGVYTGGSAGTPLNTSVGDIGTPGTSGGSGAAPIHVAAETQVFKRYQDIGDALAVLTARDKQFASQHGATIEEIAKSGQTIEEYFTGKLIIAAAAEGKLRESAGENIPPVLNLYDSLTTTLDFTGKQFDHLAKEANKASEEMLANRFGQLADAARYFGITTTAELEKVAKTSHEKFDEMRNSGLATQRDLTIAALETSQAQINADLAAGRVSKQRHDDEMKAIQQELDQWKDGASKKLTIEEQVSAESKRLSAALFNNIERQIATDIVHWKGFKDSVKSIFQTLGEDILGIMLHAFLKPVESLFADLMAGVAEKLLAVFITQKSTASLADIAQVEGEAAVGGAAAAASIAAIPIIGPALALEAGMAMYASILGTFGPLAAFAKGGDVLSDMPAYLHKNEMVLPADIAVPMRQMLKGPVGTGGLIINFNAPVSGVTRDLVASIFSSGVRQARMSGAKI